MKRTARPPLKDRVAEGAVYAFSFLAVIIIFFIFYFIFYKAFPVLSHSGFGLFTGAGFDTQISDAFYAPQSDPMLTFGMLGLVFGTVLSTLLALAVAGLLGVGCAVALCEYAPRPLAMATTALVRLLASIPSVIFGLVGIITVVPFLQSAFITTELQIEFLDYFQMTGRNLLATVVVLAFMIVPTVISLSIDAIRAVPASYKEAGFSFGMSRFRVVWKIILPTARSGITASLILAAGRGIGEAIAVSMVCGGIGYIPLLTHGFAALLSPVLPLSAAIMNKSEAMSVPAVESALFTCGALLLVLGTILSVGARLIQKRFNKHLGGRV